MLGLLDVPIMQVNGGPARVKRHPARLGLDLARVGAHTARLRLDLARMGAHTARLRAPHYLFILFTNGKNVYEVTK